MAIDLMWFAGLAVVGFVGYVIYDKFMGSSKIGYLVEFSELVGTVIVDHAKLYRGTITKDGKSMLIKGLKDEQGQTLSRPIPQAEYLVPTNGKSKKVNIIKLDIDRYGYRVPKLDNEVFTYKRDDDGKILINDGKAKLVKKSWQLCDDVVEPNTKHWGMLRRQEVMEKHRIKSKMDAWKPMIVMGTIFVFAIIALKFSSDNFTHHADLIAGKIETQQEQTDKLLGSIQGFIDDRQGVTTPENQGQPDFKQDNGEG